MLFAVNQIDFHGSCLRKSSFLLVLGLFLGKSISSSAAAADRWERGWDLHADVLWAVPDYKERGSTAAKKLSQALCRDCLYSAATTIRCAGQKRELGLTTMDN